MRIEVTPTRNPEQLKKNIEKRVDSVEIDGEKLIVEDEDISTIERTPGVESFNANGEEREGLKGEPVSEPAYARIESERDAVKALMATIQGYDLRVLNTERVWDLRQLRKYNPDIKHLKADGPKEVFDIEKSISDVDGVERVEVDMPESEEEIQLIYRKMLT